MLPGADVEQGDVVPAVPARAAQGDELLVLHYQAHLSLHCHHVVMVSSCHDSVIIMTCSLSQCRNVPRTPDTILGTRIGGNFGSTTGFLRRVKSADRKTAAVHLEGLLAGVPGGHVVVPHPHKPVSVPVPEHTRQNM